MKLCIVTIASCHSLHFARALMQSVAEHHPEADRSCVLVARDTQQADEFTTIPIASLRLPGGDDFLFQYDTPELASVAQPWISASGLMPAPRRHAATSVAAPRRHRSTGSSPRTSRAGSSVEENPVSHFVAARLRVDPSDGIL